MRSERLSEAVLVITGDYFDEHMTVVATGDGLVVIDTLATLPAGRAALPVIEAFSREPVRVLINTHPDVDHVAGNSLFSGATIVGHANCATRWNVGDRSTRPFLLQFIAALEEEALSRPAPDARRNTYLAAYRSLLPGFDEVVSAPPCLLVTEGFRLALGRVAIETDYAGPAHTDADLVVRLPGEDVIVAGDVIVGDGYAPVAHPIRGGSPAGLLRALERIERAAGPGTRVVPGHGGVGGVELVARQRRYFESLLAGVAAAQAAGMTLAEAKATVEVDEFRDDLLYDLVHPGHVEMAWKET